MPGTILVLVQDLENIGEPVPLKSLQVQIVVPPLERVILPVTDALSSTVVMEREHVALMPLKLASGAMVAPLSQRRTEAEALMEKIIARTRTSTEIRFFMGSLPFTFV